MRRHDSFFARYAWGVLAYNILVILWGAVVRASGSGNGCGEHWPLCGGEVIPHAAQIATLIEFAHRMTSGIDVILVVLLVVFSLRRLPPGHRSRHFAGAALAFTLVEGLIGAALVLFGDVGTNASMSRVVILSIHLVNTFLLLASLALTAWAAGERPEGHGGNDGTTTPAGGGWTAAYGLALLAVMAVAVTGTIAALADTLYKAATLGAGLQMDFSAASSPILRLRIIHPILAVTVAAYLLALAVRTRAASTGGVTEAHGGRAAAGGLADRARGGAGGGRAARRDAADADLGAGAAPADRRPDLDRARAAAGGTRRPAGRHGGASAGTRARSRRGPLRQPFLSSFRIASSAEITSSRFTRLFENCSRRLKAFESGLNLKT